VTTCITRPNAARALSKLSEFLRNPLPLYNAVAAKYNMLRKRGWILCDCHVFEYDIINFILRFKISWNTWTGHGITQLIIYQ
jgi:hypothetical protein